MFESKTKELNAKIGTNLERLYKATIEQEQPLAFFKGLERYIKYVLETPLLKTVVDAQIAERNERYKKIEEAEKSSVKEMTEAKESILKVIKENNIDTSSFKRFNTFSIEPFTDVVKELQAYEKGEISKGNFYSDGLEGYLFDISANLLKLGYKDELNNFLVSKEKYNEYYQRINGYNGLFYSGNENGNFIFSQTWAKRFEQVSLLQRERILKPWGVFEMILQFNRAYDAVSENMNFWDIIGDRATYDNLYSAKEIVDTGYMAEGLQYLMEQSGQEISKKVRSGFTLSLSKLNVPSFKTTVQIIHNLLIQKIDTIEEDLIPKNILVNFDEGKSILYVKGVKIPFRKFTDQYHVLKVIFENKNTFGNEIFFSEIAEKIDRYNKTYTDKTIHNHLSAIKGKVAIETGIKDLFITTTQSVRINKDCL